MLRLHHYTRILALGHFAIIVLFALCAFSLIAYGSIELWNAVQPGTSTPLTKRFDGVLECVAMLTIAMACLELADTILQEVGLEFHDRPFRTTIAGKPALVAHGDGLGSGDLRYRFLKTVVRSPVTIGLFRWLHPDLGIRIAQAVSRTEGRETDDAMRGRAAFIREWALRQLAREPDLHYVVCGHSHLPDVVEADAGRWYLNAGDWINHFTYIEVTPDEAPKLARWEETA